MLLTKEEETWVVLILKALEPHSILFLELESQESWHEFLDIAALTTKFKTMVLGQEVINIFLHLLCRFRLVLNAEFSFLIDTADTLHQNVILVPIIHFHQG